MTIIINKMNGQIVRSFNTTITQFKKSLRTDYYPLLVDCTHKMHRGYNQMRYITRYRLNIWLVGPQCLLYLSLDLFLLLPIYSLHSATFSLVPIIFIVSSPFHLFYQSLSASCIWKIHFHVSDGCHRRLPSSE